jgi:hypothetical protein
VRAGARTNVIAIIRDVTERRQAAEELVEPNLFRFHEGLEVINNK